MDSYLKGRGFKDVESGDSNFEGLLDQKSGEPDAKQKNVSEDRPQEKSVIYEEEGCPKVNLFQRMVVPHLSSFICLTDDFWKLIVFIDFL